MAPLGGGDRIACPQTHREPPLVRRECADRGQVKQGSAPLVARNEGDTSMAKDERLANMPRARAGLKQHLNSLKLTFLNHMKSMMSVPKQTVL